VSFAQTPSSYKHLMALEAKLTASANSLVDQGVKLVSYGPDQATGKLRIDLAGDQAEPATASTAAALADGATGTVNSTEGTSGTSSDVTDAAAAQAALSDLLGADDIEFSKQAPTEAASTRNDDSAPWYGADAAHHGTDEACTTGFSLWLGSSTYTLTAAHCFAVGEEIKNAFVSGTGSINGGNGVIGTVTSRRTDAYGEDVELIKSNADPQFVSGVPNSSTIDDVDGFLFPQVGMTVQNNGAYSGTVSSKVDAIDQCSLLRGEGGAPDRVVCDLAHTSSSGIATETGDSGGPVSTTVLGLHYAVGTTSGGNGSKVNCTYHPSQLCYTSLTFTQIQDTLALYGAELLSL
jgi:hypothetical protein